MIIGPAPRQGDTAMKKKNTPNDVFSSFYTVKGDGVAVLKPRALKDNAKFKRSLQEMRSKDILSPEVSTS